MKPNWKSFYLLSVLLIWVGCSSSEVDDEGVEEEFEDEMELTDSDEAETDEVPEEEEEIAELEPLPPPTDEAPKIEEAPPAETETAFAPIPEPEPIAEPAPMSGEFENYTVQQGDTLMKIAFETSGDLYQWKKILENNSDQISDPNQLKPGAVLKVERSSTPVAIDRNGESYLIKSGDTLGTISGDVYGTQSKWRKIYENNRQLIKDPNKIYAGFYLYYVMSPEDQAEKEQFQSQQVAPKPLVDQGLPVEPPAPQMQTEPAPPPVSAPPTAGVGGSPTDDTLDFGDPGPTAPGRVPAAQ